MYFRSIIILDIPNPDPENKVSKMTKWRIENGLKHLDSVDQEEFISMLGNVVENTPKVASRLFKLRPFPNTENFIRSLAMVIDSLTPNEKVKSIAFIYINQF